MKSKQRKLHIVKVCEHCVFFFILFALINTYLFDIAKADLLNFLKEIK